MIPAFHGTSLRNAYSIISTNTIRLSSVSGKEAEAQFAKHPFFFSVRRNRLLTSTNYYAVTLELNAQLLHAKAKREAVDYWQVDDQTLRAKANEQEDRYYFQRGELKRVIQMIKVVHINLDLLNKRDNQYLRQLLILCKRHGIVTYLYDDKRAYLNLNYRKAKPISEIDLSVDIKGVFTMSEDERPYIPRKRNRYDLIDLALDTMYGNVPKTDDKNLEYLRSKMLPYRLGDAVRSLNADLHNASSDRDKDIRRKANALTAYMQKHKLNVQQLCDAVSEKLHGDQ